MRSILFVLGCGCYDWSDAAAGARCAPLRVIHVFQHSAEPGQHRTIPALRLKHRSGSCGTASALPKCSIMSGCGTRIVLRGQKPLALCDRCPCFGSLFPPLAALTFAASSIICAFGLASAAPRSPYRHLDYAVLPQNLLTPPPSHTTPHPAHGTNGHQTPDPPHRWQQGQRRYRSQAGGRHPTGQCDPHTAWPGAARA